MAVAALVLGIVSLIIAVIPFCGYIAIVPAIIGVVLGIVDLVKKVNQDKESEEKTKKGMTITGLALSAGAVVVLMFWTFLFFCIGITESGLDPYYRYNDFDDIMRHYDITERF